MKTHNLIKKVLISAEDIQKRVQELAQRISQDYAGCKPLMVSVLKGSWIFFADLVRQLEIDPEVAFLSASSYGNSTKSSGTLRLLQDLTVDCAGRDVIIVEDIIDSGVTLSHLRELFLQRGAKSLEIATLLSKPSRRKINVEVKYTGFEIPDEFVIGYGMDFAENFRGLQDICVLKEEAYR